MTKTIKSQKRTLSLPTILIAQIVLLVVISPLSALGNREVLRQRLDSLDVETQLRKRSGKPIDDLESERALLHDSIVGLRGTALSVPADPPPADAGSLWASIGSALSSFLDSTFSFKPAGLFDWIIVGTGVVALLSGLLLFIGLIAGGGRKGGTPKKNVRKINLAPSGTQPAVQDIAQTGAAYNYGSLPETISLPPQPPSPPQIPPELESLMQNLRKATAPTQTAEVAPPTPQPLRPTPLPPPVPKAPPAPPAPPPPLVVNAPDSAPAPNRKSIPKMGTPGFNDLIAADSKSGLSDVEISRRYQISLDQVRLTLRMKQDT